VQGSLVKLKTPYDIKKIKSASLISIGCFKYLQSFLCSGQTTFQIDKVIDEYLAKNNASPSFKEINGYKFSSCISINDEAVHGLPDRDRVITSGDIVTIDIGVKKDKYYTDSSFSFIIAPVSNENNFLLKTTYSAMLKGISQLYPGNTINRCGDEISKFVKKNNLNLIKKFSGHGVGFNHHEEPLVLNFFAPKNDLVLQEGMVLAIEPVVTFGSGEVYLDKNGWTYKTKDKKSTCQFEHTVCITKDGPKILTYWENL